GWMREIKGEFTPYWLPLRVFPSSTCTQVRLSAPLSATPRPRADFSPGPERAKSRLRMRVGSTSPRLGTRRGPSRACPPEGEAPAGFHGDLSGPWRNWTGLTLMSGDTAKAF